MSMMQGFRSTLLVSRRAWSIAPIRQTQVGGRWLSAAPEEANSGASDDSNKIHDSFRIFDLPHSFHIDAKTLQNSYREHMKKLHPDKHSLKSSDDQQVLERQAAAVTHAYDTLKRPHARATHLLALLGRPMEESASGELIGPEFLMEIMDIRQEIEHAVADEDENNRKDLLKQLYDSNQSRVDETCQELGDAFEAKDMDKALQLTALLQYWNRIEETLREKMDSVK